MSHAVEEMFHTPRGEGRQAGRAAVSSRFAEALTAALHARGFETAVETDGTVAPPPGRDWICVSPTSDAPPAIGGGGELKRVDPQVRVRPERFAHLGFGHFILQPIGGPGRAADTDAPVRCRMAHPRRRPGLQTHKVWGIA